MNQEHTYESGREIVWLPDCLSTLDDLAEVEFGVSDFLLEARGIVIFVV